MSENKQNQGGMGKDIMKLLMKNKLVIGLLILTIVSGIIFFTMLSNYRNKEVSDSDKQAFLSELTGEQQQVVDKTKENKKIETETTNVDEQDNVEVEDVQFENTNVQNTSMAENSVAVQENDYYKIEIVGAETTEDKIIVNIKYQVKENPSNSETDNDLIYLSTSKTYLATSAGNLPLQEFSGVGLIPLENSMEKYGKEHIDDFIAYVSNIKSESRIPTLFELKGTLVFNKPENYTMDDSFKIKLVSMPLAANKVFVNKFRKGFYDLKVKFVKPYPYYIKDYIFEDMLDVSIVNQG